MWDKDTLKDAERLREHNERMHKAGQEIAAMMDRAVEEQNQAAAEMFFEAYSRKYGLNDDEAAE